MPQFYNINVSIPDSHEAFFARNKWSFSGQVFIGPVLDMNQLDTNWLLDSIGLLRLAFFPSPQRDHGWFFIWRFLHLVMSMPSFVSEVESCILFALYMNEKCLWSGWNKNWASMTDTLFLLGLVVSYVVLMTPRWYETDKHTKNPTKNH